MKGNLEVCIEDGKMSKGVSTQRHAWMRSNCDLLVIYDFGSGMLLALIALLMVCNVSFIY